MRIDVCIPHDIEAVRLGEVYNRHMARADGWVLFIDSDVFLLHPKWYDIFIRAIETLGDKAGFITCLTNRIGNPVERHNAYGGDDIAIHTELAIKMEQDNRGVYVDETNNKGLSGHVILTHKKAWTVSGGFTEGLGVLGTDNQYHYSIRTAGYRAYVMHDQYVYHRYKRYWKCGIYKTSEWCK